ncbi:hypothetical protein TanjilG_32293 [Lupinus angustifolius]|uniref:Uncharacterized protein n=1 Tax=Lupinus angustifolius TaxID=3871 RepID=A0A4P1R131_LUPAN|nr:PREDICTED: uncharacterized protein DDB_G0271670-like [Lupinus angustifolius]OIV99034.1 hypothetical protein TanjilG_32293 [Lupinus angustifolius]
MASLCVNNNNNNNFSSFTWLTPQHSLSPDNLPDLDSSAGDFEFHLEDPVTMLPADQLFSDGKLVPLHFHLSTLNPFTPSSSTTTAQSHSPETCSPDLSPANITEKPPVETFLFSPKAPRCSSRWRELLGLKKKQISQNANSDTHKTASSCSSTKSIKQFLHHRSSKTTSSSSETTSITLPLLKDSDSESVSISSRLSLSSSSSSGHDHEDLPRLSLDSDKTTTIPNPTPIQISLHRNPNAHPRMSFVKHRSSSFDKTNNPNPNHGNRVARNPIRKVESNEVDSPRMNSSGKIVFQNLERSSSSPSTFNGGPRFKHRGMERSYSANVRVTPVLNVPVCSLIGSSKSGSVFGLGPFFSSSSTQKKDGASGSGGGSNRHRCNRN